MLNFVRRVLIMMNDTTPLINIFGYVFKNVRVIKNGIKYFENEWL